MSNLIIMPGSEPTMDPSFVLGRTLALNVANIRKFQTFGFYLGPNRPSAVVPQKALTGPATDRN